MKVHSDITKIVGNTPLVRINRITDGAEAQVFAKLEFYNPTSTVKDRIGIAMIDAAEKSGQLKAGGTIVEATSGNTSTPASFISETTALASGPREPNHSAVWSPTHC